jgi:hypothetical protein
LEDVDENLTARLNQLSEEIGNGQNEVDAALESDEDARQIAAGKLVESLAAKYRELIAEMPAADRDTAERGLGRRLTDLRRAAAALSRRDAGRTAQLARDAGFVPFLEQRMPPKTIVPPRAAPSKKLSVGGELEAWCGKCKEVTTHNVVAMVADQAKQVICQVCSSRHEYRTEPPARYKSAARESAGTTTTTVAGKRGSSAEERELQRRQELKRQLQKELSEAVDPRPFDPRGRYKAGEIIVHAEHGRGKIENVLRGSLLVRFLEGLRPLDLS